MGDGHLGKCISCTKIDVSKRTIPRKCFTCDKKFLTWVTEIKRGGGITCSRVCYFKRFRKIVPRGEKSANWKGDKVGRAALHNWVEKHLGKPTKCAKCQKTDQPKYEWANISREYKREITDWIRLCKKCHVKFDGSKNFKNFPRLSIEQFMKT